jgi:Rrf2 family protein
MKISKKGEYALKALIELAINYDKGEALTLVDEIVERNNIPPVYLEQILLSLKNAGVVISKRGVGGGYSLSRDPENISLGEVIRVVEGPLAPLDCVSVSRHVDCPEESSCGLYSVMREVRDAIANILDNISLKDVAKRTLNLREKTQRVPSYAI